MRFVRLAVIEFIDLNLAVPDSELRQDRQRWVQVQRLKGAAEIGRVPYMAFGFSDALGTTYIREGKLSLDEKMRLDCDELIEAAANSIAVCYGCQRKVWSYLTPYALMPLDGRETATFATLTTYPNEMQVRFERPWVGTTPDAYLAGLTDRLEGAAVMAECMNNQTYLGRYRECIRLFELAFRRGGKAVLEKPLAQFLALSPYQYSDREVRRWLSFRDRSMHADKKRNDRLAFERDVQWFMERMQQAALEVLFNKDRWHGAAIARRALWTPLAAVMPDGGSQGVQGHPFSMEVAFMDTFRVWPVWMHGGFELPPGWWWASAPPGLATTTA